MKKRENNSSGAWALRITLSLALASMSAILLASSFKAAPRPVHGNTPSISLGGFTNATASITTGATIYVTYLGSKVAGIGTGGCSLQEAIYSSILHDSLDGGAHGIAIDATHPDRFITTDCVMGTGNGDIVVLPSGGVFQLRSLTVSDAYNYMGPTATPIIFSTMTIEAAGATLQWMGTGNSRLFAIGQATVKTPNGVASGTGGLTIRNAYIKGFHVHGGNGGGGGGGGRLGAGGAIYVHTGTLVVENSTFDSKSAVGGNGNTSTVGGGGGGGLSGNGGSYGGGGGARGGGASGQSSSSTGIAAGGGGGTVFPGTNGSLPYTHGSGGYLCGGAGGAPGVEDGQNATCRGGGGGGGGSSVTGGVCLGGSGDGGYGQYGGGGGGGSGNGGSGGFGGGGGSGDADGCDGNGGDGGFGGGGGSGVSVNGPGPGRGGPYGGNGDTGGGGGGGGALGGAIFNDSGRLTIHNSTFYNNSVTRGIGAHNGGDAGGAIFSYSGVTTTIVDCTISGNQATGSGGGVVVYSDYYPYSLTLNNTIIANNGANECLVGGAPPSTGAGNLIMQNGSGGTPPFGACPGVVTNVDPQLQPLEPPSTNGGKTPTRAIPLFSSAMGVADPGTSLSYDQRYANRPQPDTSPRNGYDIGAYEVCRKFFGGGLQSWICSETNISPPPTTTLTMHASPANEGTTNPTPGSHNVDLNSVVPIQATSYSGYGFKNWTGNVADPNAASTTVVMNQPQTVTANFAPLIQVTVQTNPTGRSFKVDGTTYTATKTFSWGAGSLHTIATTSPQSAGTGVRYVWTSWSDGGAISHNVAPTTNKTYTANFTKQYYLTMKAGTGGTVSPASAWKNSGATVSISATPATGYHFTSWTGTGTGSYSGTNNPSSITMGGPITETATF